MILLEQVRSDDELVASKELAEIYPSCFTANKVYSVSKRRHFGDPNLYLGVICDFGEHHILGQTESHHMFPFIQQKGGWIGVDLDKTLAVYEKWQGPYNIGEPIPVMVERVKGWLKEGRDVRIFTARVTDRKTNADGTPHDLTAVRSTIAEWCLTNLGQVLPITNVKDWDMMELWDDRVIQVRPNTGTTLEDELEAIRNAELPPKYGDTNER